MANFDDVKFLVHCDKKNMRTLIDMYVYDGPFMIADDYQAKTRCSDKARDIVERGANGMATIEQVSTLICWTGIVLQIGIGLGKTVYKLARFVKRRL